MPPQCADISSSHFGQCRHLSRDSRQVQIHLQGRTCLDWLAMPAATRANKVNQGSPQQLEQIAGQHSDTGRTGPVMSCTPRSPVRLHKRDSRNPRVQDTASLFDRLGNPACVNLSPALMSASCSTL